MRYLRLFLLLTLIFWVWTFFGAIASSFIFPRITADGPVYQFPHQMDVTVSSNNPEPWIQPVPLAHPVNRSIRYWLLHPDLWLFLPQGWCGEPVPMGALCFGGPLNALLLVLAAARADRVRLLLRGRRRGLPLSLPPRAS